MTTRYYIDHGDGRMTYRTVEDVARALVARGGGPVGVVTDQAGARDLTQAELRRLGHAVREARARAVSRPKTRQWHRRLACCDRVCHPPHE